MLFHQAKAEFKAAFTDTLVELHAKAHRANEGSAMDILRAGYLTHLAAYIKLAGILPIVDRRTVDKAWCQYTGDRNYDNGEERVFYRFAHFLEPQLTGEEHHLLAIKQINALFDAAT